MSRRDAVAAGFRVAGGKARSAAGAVLAASLMIAATATAQARTPDIIFAGTSPGAVAGTSTRAALPEGSIVVAKRGGSFARGAAVGVAVGSGRAAARERNRNTTDAAADPTPADTNAAPEREPASAATTATKPSVEPTAAAVPAGPIGPHDCLAGCNAPPRAAAAAARAQPAQAAANGPSQGAGPVAATFECVAGCGSSGPQRPAGGNSQVSAGTPTSSVTVLRGATRSKVYGVSN
jgi:hypothetical protein